MRRDARRTPDYLRSCIFVYVAQLSKMKISRHRRRRCRCNAKFLQLASRARKRRDPIAIADWEAGAGGREKKGGRTLTRVSRFRVSIMDAPNAKISQDMPVRCRFPSTRSTISASSDRSRALTKPARGRAGGIARRKNLTSGIEPEREPTASRPATELNNVEILIRPHERVDSWSRASAASRRSVPMQRPDAASRRSALPLPGL